MKLHRTTKDNVDGIEVNGIFFASSDFETFDNGPVQLRDVDEDSSSCRVVCDYTERSFHGDTPEEVLEKLTELFQAKKDRAEAVLSVLQPAPKVLVNGQRYKVLRHYSGKDVGAERDLQVGEIVQCTDAGDNEVTTSDEWFFVVDPADLRPCPAPETDQ